MSVLSRAINIVTVGTILCNAGGAAAEREVLLFPYFQQASGGASGVFMMYSLDGTTFHHVNNGQPIFQSTFGNGNHLTRDPSILLGPDNRFYMTWTPRFFNQHLGYAVSDDLENWDAGLEQVWDADDNVVNGWAPEVHYDHDESEFVILFAGTDRNRFPNNGNGTAYSPTPSENGPGGAGASGDAPLAHRVYRVTTPDFQVFSEADLFFDPGFNVIDSQVVYDDRGTEDDSDDRYVMVFKDERTHTNDGSLFSLANDADRRKTTHFASSSSLQGEYTDISERITGRGSVDSTYSGDSEGQALVQFNGEWYLFIDPYTDGGLTYTVHQQTDSSGGISFDPDDWIEITDQVDFPGNGPIDVAHGTPFVVDVARVANLLQEELGLDAGDLNADGIVGIEDLDVLLARWGEDVPRHSWIDGDVSGDGQVGQPDLDILIQNWGDGTPPEANIPEPCSALGLGALMLPSLRPRTR